MTYFTHEETTPSASTLNLIRQIAYTYRTVKLTHKTVAVCLN